MDGRLKRYHEDRNQLLDGAASGLSPHIHFGHISVVEILESIWDRCNWSTQKLTVKPNGSRNGWWQLPAAEEAFMDELITWREIGFVFAHRHPDTYDCISSLPDWALATIEAHRQDTRPITYTLEELDEAKTHDPLWNAAQCQLKQDGVMHNYLRMLWGKKIYQWTPTPEAAIECLIELNNRYALDGRDPNSYSGIFWLLGRFDRAWGPERPIFGKLRYMTSESTARKMKTKPYIELYSSTTN